MTDNLDQLETWLGGLIANLSPAEQAKFARDQAIALRRAQTERIAAQKNPDGTSFAPRKKNPRPPFRSKKGRIKRRAAAAAAGRPMFRKVRRLMGVESSASEIAVGFRNASTGRIARVHQLGLRDRVTRAKDAPTASYPARELLGFTEDDRRRLMDAALSLVTPT